MSLDRKVGDILAKRFIGKGKLFGINDLCYLSLKTGEITSIIPNKLEPIYSEKLDGLSNDKIEYILIKDTDAIDTGAINTDRLNADALDVLMAKVETDKDFNKEYGLLPPMIQYNTNFDKEINVLLIQCATENIVEYQPIDNSMVEYYSIRRFRKIFEKLKKMIDNTNKVDDTLKNELEENIWC